MKSLNLEDVLWWIRKNRDEGKRIIHFKLTDDMFIILADRETVE